MTDVSPSPGTRLGLWAFVLALVAVVWPVLTTVGVILSLGTAPDALRQVVVVVFFVGWLVVPLAFVAAIVLAILALLRSARRGKVLAGVAIGLLVLLAAGIAILGATGLLGSYSV